ncbi:hypothetical protein BHE74_00045416 [Ensete ventricosum]|nr:hypothetical protein BHE74_00045416 [Ensete ventricosum]
MGQEDAEVGTLEEYVTCCHARCHEENGAQRRLCWWGIEAQDPDNGTPPLVKFGTSRATRRWTVLERYFVRGDPRMESECNEDVTKRQHGATDHCGIVYGNTTHTETSREGHDHAKVIRKGRGSYDEFGEAQLPKNKASVRKEVDLEECHSAVEADIPIAKKGT